MEAWFQSNMDDTVSVFTKKLKYFCFTRWTILNMATQPKSDHAKIDILQRSKQQQPCEKLSTDRFHIRLYKPDDNPQIITLLKHYWPTAHYPMEAKKHRLGFVICKFKQSSTKNKEKNKISNKTMIDNSTSKSNDNSVSHKNLSIQNVLDKISNPFAKLSKPSKPSNDDKSDVIDIDELDIIGFCLYKWFKPVSADKATPRDIREWLEEDFIKNNIISSDTNNVKNNNNNSSNNSNNNNGSNMDKKQSENNEEDEKMSKQLVRENTHLLDNLYKLKTHIIHLTEFAIHPKYLHQGLGTLILTRFLKSFPNGTRFGLEVDTTNKNAIQLYEKCGFKTVRKMKDYYQQGEHCYKMTLWKDGNNYNCNMNSNFNDNDKNVKTNNQKSIDSSDNVPEAEMSMQTKMQNLSLK